MHSISHLLYEPHFIDHQNGLALLNEEESAHISRVLRKRVGEIVHVTNGQGGLFQAEIVEIQKRNIVLSVLSKTVVPPSPHPEIHIAIAPLKQLDRFEWFLEKAVEIGVTSIAPVATKRTERTVLKHERLEKIMVSAMKQSQRCYLPTLHALKPFGTYVQEIGSNDHVKMIGWCAEEGVLEPARPQTKPTQLLIGPEGDFTPEEAALAKAAGFAPISLGNYRLRTETAAIVAIALLNTQ